MLRCCTSQWRASWCEACDLAAVRWEWRDPPEPLEAVQGAAANLHYYEAEELLTGPALMKVKLEGGEGGQRGNRGGGVWGDLGRGRE